MSSLPYDTGPPDDTGPTDGNNSTVQNGGTTTSNKIAFTFAGVDNVAISGFVCILDNNTNGLFSCSLTVIINNLAVGNHTFEVDAVDASGNKDCTPVSFTWNVTDRTNNTCHEIAFHLEARCYSILDSSDASILYSNLADTTIFV
jgi:hypothetical protein